VVDPDRAIRLRDAGAADVERLHASQLATAALTYGRELTADERVHFLDRLARGVGDPSQHIRVADGPGEEPTYFWLEQRSRDEAYLLDFHIGSSDRGTGLATRLFDEVVQIAQTLGATRLEFVVGRDNTRARGFFTRVGAYEVDDDRTPDDTRPVRYRLAL